MGETKVRVSSQRRHQRAFSVPVDGGFGERFAHNHDLLCHYEKQNRIDCDHTQAGSGEVQAVDRGGISSNVQGG